MQTETQRLERNLLTGLLPTLPFRQGFDILELVAPAASSGAARPSRRNRGVSETTHRD